MNDSTNAPTNPPRAHLCGQPCHTVLIWPTGERISVCDGHYLWATTILRTLGHPAIAVPPIGSDSPTCTQHVEPKPTTAPAPTKPNPRADALRAHVDRTDPDQQGAPTHDD